MMNRSLLPKFAEEFNRAGHRTAAGQQICVQLFTANSGTIMDELVARAGRGAALDPRLPNPTIVTPAADHWISQVNYQVGSTVIDRTQSQTFATTWLGIATYREMAECLGWPAKDIGIADVLALATDPRGWRVCPTAKADWGRQPLVSFTDPDSSSSARSMLFTLYSIAAKKTPEQLTAADVSNPAVVDFVKRFQNTVAHYVPDTLILNSKIYLGPRYGHFFFISESNLVQLYQGKLAVTVGAESKPQPLERPMVMIYPKEGAAAHNHSGNIVQANWVAPQQVEAAQKWIAFVREGPQQQAFMAEGFRPGAAVPVADTISSQFGLDPNKPVAVIDPDKTDPAAGAAIAASWGEVKKPGIVTFVVDISGSMAGAKLEQAKKGLGLALDELNQHNSAGLVAFSDRIVHTVPVAPLKEAKYTIAETVLKMQANGGTALYDAIKAGIQMSDEAPGDEKTIRGVVVLTDGKANRGAIWLDDLIQMGSRKDETRIPSFKGAEGDKEGRDERGKSVPTSEIGGTGLSLKTRHSILVFFVGIGDADMEIGRMLAEATGAAFRGATEQDLAEVIKAFGKYF